MQRRKFILGMGATAAGGSAILGSGAFTSVEAERSISVDVVGDADAFLGLGPCEGSSNGDYVTGSSDGAMAIDLSGENDEVAGEGVNPESFYRFDNVFQIRNQGTQAVCVDFVVDVPEIPGEVPSRYSFSHGDPAVVFYRDDDSEENDDSEETVSVDGEEPDPDSDEAFALETGESECFGLEVRSFGFEAGEDILEDATLAIRAEAGAECSENIADPEPGDELPDDGLVGYWSFDGDDGETATDQSESGNDGRFEDDATVAEGDGVGDGDAAEFDGDGAHIEIDGFPELEQGVSISAWINPDDTGEGNRIFADDIDQTGYALSLGDGGDGQVRFYSRGKSDDSLDTEEIIDSGEWYHVAGVYNDEEETRKIYIGGELEADIEEDTGEWDAGEGAASIGGELDDSDEERYFEGLIDEVRVYERPLTEDEIETLAEQFSP